MAEGDLGRSLRTGTIDPNIPQRQTSLIVDPPNGQLSALLRFELPNWQAWSFAGELTDERTIVGVLSSEQGGLPVTFRRPR